MALPPFQPRSRVFPATGGFVGQPFEGWLTRGKIVLPLSPRSLKPALGGFKERGEKGGMRPHLPRPWKDRAIFIQSLWDVKAGASAVALQSFRHLLQVRWLSEFKRPPNVKLGANRRIREMVCVAHPT